MATFIGYFVLFLLAVGVVKWYRWTKSINAQLGPMKQEKMGDDRSALTIGEIGPWRNFLWHDDD